MMVYVLNRWFKLSRRPGRPCSYESNSSWDFQMRARTSIYYFPPFFKLRYKSKFQMDGCRKWYVDTLPYDLRCGSQLIRSRPSSLWAAISNDLHDLCSGINSSMDYNINHLELESKFCSNSAVRHKALSHRPKKPAAWNNISKTWLIC